jgi:hypothetical protein
VLAILEILAGFGLFLGLYYFLANSENLEWNRKTKRFENWRKSPEYKNLKWDSTKNEWKN